MASITPIAIIGMGCRLPGGASSPEKLWDMLINGQSGWGDVPIDRWNKDAFYNPNKEAKESINSRSGYFLKENIAEFDSRFFNIIALEASTMDPQQRILLETTCEALENAGIPLESIRGSDTSVYVGVFARDWDRMGYKDLQRITKAHITGAGEAVVSNRISYLLDLRGASLTIDTGCSGSVVALHQACQSLRIKETNMAIVGGTQLLLHPDQSVPMSSVGMVNPDGRCYVFDARGSGYARGEGVGTVILKRLDDAIADGDPIHAIIRNSGLNQDGRTLGISLPNPEAQAALMDSVYKAAGLDTEETVYVEAHGTGTQAGDKAEISSIWQVFCAGLERKTDLYVGSVKSNIGHLEASSGIAGLVKVVMILKKGMVPPHLDLITPKPSLKLDERQIKIPLEPISLERAHDKPWRVSLNSFGYGGTNAHVILESPPNSHNNINASAGESHDLCHKQGMPHLITLSANSKASLLGNIRNLHSWVDAKAENNFPMTSLAYTLALRRSIFPWRYSFVATNREELLTSLGEKSPITAKSLSAPCVTFIFTGQGAQWFGMGRELIQTKSRFATSIIGSDRILKNLGCEWNLQEELLRDEKTSRVGNSEISQPLTTAIQLALVDLLDSLSVKPDSVCGHSSGEIAAAYAAGALSHELAMKIAYQRGICSARAKFVNGAKGAMLAVGMSEKDILPLLMELDSGIVTVACVNSPESITISGDEGAIDQLMVILDKLAIFNRKLLVDTAYHSHHMQEVASQYLDSLEGSTVQDPKPGIAFYSSVTGLRKVTGFGPDYWVQNLVSKVRFSDALKSLVEGSGSGKSTVDLYVEIGPHMALSGPLRQTMSKLDLQGRSFHYQAALLRRRDALRTVLELAGQLLDRGYPIDLRSIFCINGDSKPPVVLDDLIPYAWEHSTKFWHESTLSRNHRLRPFPYHDLLGVLDTTGNYRQPYWRYQINVNDLPWLRGHVIDGLIIFPATGYLCMAVEGMKQIQQVRKSTGTVTGFVLREISFLKPIVVPEQRPDGHTPEVDVLLTFNNSSSVDKGTYERFHIFALDENNHWSEHCSGRVAVQIMADSNEVEGCREVNQLAAMQLERQAQIESRCIEDVLPCTFYGGLKSSGNDFGPAFSTITQLRFGDCCAVGTVNIPDIMSSMPGSYMQPHVIHPATLDATQQLIAGLFKRHCSDISLMPTYIEEMIVSVDIPNTAGDQLRVAADFASHSSRFGVGNSCVFTCQTVPAPILTIRGLQLQGIGEGQSASTDVPFHRKMSYRITWDKDVDSLTLQPDHGHLRSSNSRLASGQLLKVAETISTTDARVTLKDRAAAIYLNDLVRIGTGNYSPRDNYACHFLSWATRFLESGQGKALLEEAESIGKEITLVKSALSGLEGRLLSSIGANLLPILAGEEHALNLLQEAVGNYHQTDTFKSVCTSLTELIKLLAFKKPRMRILEIVAGQGHTAFPLIESLCRKSEILLDRYDITDPDSEALGVAQARAHDWEHCIDIKTLDISGDILTQGFEESSYDLIISSSLIFTTGSHDKALSNIKRLLRKDGRFLRVELSRDLPALNTIFGALSRWWAFESNTIFGKSSAKAQWESALQQNSFENIVSIRVEQGEAPSRAFLILATATEPTADDLRPIPNIQLVHNSRSHSVLNLFSTLATSLPCSESAWESVMIQPEDTYIILDDVANALLLDPSPNTFQKLKDFLITAKNVMWISVQERSSDFLNPVKGMVTGLARVIRRENEGMRFITLDVQQGLIDDTSDIVKIILSTAENCFWPRTEIARSQEMEYVIRSNELLIPRIAPDTRFNTWVDRTCGSSQFETHRFLQRERPLKLRVETPGLLSSLCFVDDPRPSMPIAADELEIEPRAYGINFKDVFIALGQMPPTTEMVGELSGVVSDVGSALCDRFRVGDRVVGVGAQPFTNRARVKGDLCCQLPSSLSFSQGASIPVIFLTAYHSLIGKAQLQKGQSILIHAASGGVGQAAIKLAQYIGAEIFATVGSVAKRQLLAEKYNIPESHIFSTRTRTFKQGILRLTQGRGVDVVLNSLSGEWLSESWDCVASLGTFVEIGKRDIYQKNHISMVPFDKEVTFASVDLTVLFKIRSSQCSHMLTEIMAMFDSGVLDVVQPINTVPISEIEAAFRLISARKHTGKVVLEANSDTMVKAILAKPPPLKLDAEGSYVIAGGLGDLGRKICHLLAANGAKSIITLSRRTLDVASREAFEKELRDIGAAVHIIQCDISSQASMQEAALRCSEGLPPVRGVINAGMVLRDQLFENMTLEDYSVSLGPKVRGTINLHNAFASSSLDFFILLSSVSCIVGKTGQLNYSVGNAFLDAFAHCYEKAGHTQYISLNLGAIDGSEAITSLPLRQQELMREGAVLMQFEELFKLLEYSMGDSARRDGCSQSIQGFDRESFENIQDDFALNNPIFSHLPYHGSSTSSPAGAVTSAVASVESLLRSATSIDQVTQIVSEAISEKITLFLDIPKEDVNLEKPFVEFGLDSLISIEFRNWMVRTFSARIQSSEIMGALSIRGIAGIIASRSTYVNKELQIEPSKEIETNGVAAQEVLPNVDENSPVLKCCRYASHVPRQPLPNFHRTLEQLLANFRPLAASEDEFLRFQSSVHELQAPDSPALEIYQRLAKKAVDPQVGNWVGDWMVEARHLKRRDLITPYNNYLITYHKCEGLWQAETAAIIAATAFIFKREVEADTVEPHWHFGTPSCMDSWKWLFGSVRVPHPQCDRMKKYDESNYCIVLRRGHIFKVALQNGDGAPIPPSSLTATFQAILNQVQDQGNWLGILTTDERDSWAKIRGTLSSITEANSLCLKTIEAAAFIICLDDGSPTTPSARVKQFHIGDGFNRWHDKSIQFIVSTNGACGILVEHTMLDGLAVHRLNELITQAFTQHQPNIAPKPDTISIGPNQALEEYSFEIPQEISLDSHLDVLRQRYLSNTSKYGYCYHESTQITKDFLMERGYPIKGIFDLTFRLAGYLHFGLNVASWESVSLAHFHQGRTDRVQVVTDSVAEFCSSATDNEISPLQRRKMLLNAVKDYRVRLQLASAARGHFWFLEALKYMWPCDKQPASLFTDPLWLRASRFDLTTEQTDGLGAEVTYVADNPTGFWVSYCADSHRLRCSIVGPPDDVMKFQRCLDTAAAMVKTILE